MSSLKKSAKLEEIKEDEIKEDERTESHDETEKSADESDAKDAPKAKIMKVKETNFDDNEDSDDEEDDDDDDHETTANGKVPLLDQPLELSGTRERKKVQRFSEEIKQSASEKPVEIPDGKGVPLGEIPSLENQLPRAKIEDLKVLHRILFNRIGKSTIVRKNIKKFRGFDFIVDSDQYKKKKAFVAKIDSKSLKNVCSILSVTKGTRDVMAENILQYLLEPKLSNKDIAAAKRASSKRSSAQKANSKGFSEEEDEEKRPVRARRTGKRKNMKKESDSENEENDKQEEQKESKTDDKSNDSENDDTDESDSDSDNQKSKKKKSNVQKSPKTNAKKTLSRKQDKKSVPKKKKISKSEDENEKNNEGSSSDDEPLAKKPKSPPTDEEIKTYVKEILEGANLEEITMKTVCKQVYAHYPDFDLSHKKDFIKDTVKSLIST